MTNTVIIVPINHDTRPTSFSYAFENAHGVGIDVTINTREEAVAQKVADDLMAKMDWRSIPGRSDHIPTLMVPLVIAVGLLILGIVVAFAAILLDFIGWLPDVAEMFPNLVEGSYSGPVVDVMKLYTKGAFIALIPLSILGMIANHAETKST